MADKNLDEYQEKRFYSANTKSRENGFAKFEKDGAYYFALYKDGDIVLLSQAYVGTAGRDNGIESVKKNRRISKRYRFDTRKGGKHGFGLFAGNGQEIAISANYRSKAEAERVAARLMGTAKASAKTSASQKSTSKKAVTTAKAPRKVSDEDDYRPLAFYNKHTKGRKKGIEKFKGEDGLFYFAYFENGKIRLISEGYPTVTAQDTGAASVEKNIKIEKRYDYRGPLKNGKYDFRLKAGNGKEIARSVWYGSAAAAATGAAYLMGTRKRSVSKAKPKPVAKASKPQAKPKSKPKAAPIVAAASLATASATPAMAKAAKPVAPRDKDDDYLKCEEYHGHPVTDAEHNLALFSHSNNKEYFVIYDDEGDVLIRSEGFDSISKRSSELAAVLRLKDNEDNYTRVEKNGYALNILKDENGREVGRSCLRKIVPPAAIVKPAAAAAPVGAGGTAAGVPAGSSGGYGGGWLKWLLPLLLLLLLGLWGLKGCSDGKAKKLAADAAAAQKLAADKAAAAKKLAAEKAAQAKKIAAEQAAAAKAAAAEAAAKAEEAAANLVPDPSPEPVAPKVETPKVSANMSRLCGPSESLLFDVPNYATPISVGRLGTFPQFGDSHGLTPTEFYNKLANRYAAKKYDQQYLDYLARQLGYANGFSDMSASDFSNETLAQGTKGLLGYGEFHGVSYSALNVKSSRDLEAFRVRAANGMDVHFMKSCGNYMYVCN